MVLEISNCFMTAFCGVFYESKEKRMKGIKKLQIPKRMQLMVSLTVLVFSGTGCVSPERSGSQADARTILYPAAEDLRSVALRDVVVVKDGAITDRPLTTNLVRKVADEARDAVVSIYVKSNTPYRLHILPFNPLGGIPVTLPGFGLGSGFFIHPSGYIMTNDHVVKDAAQIKILTSSGKDYDVVVVAREPAYDLALLKVTNSPRQDFKVLPLGDSDTIDAGDMVIAVGNPLGLGHTVTSGIISQTYRDLSDEADEDGRRVDLIQTDTAINPGSSGGPLITLDGSCVGVNTAIIAVAQGIGFAVPSNQVLEFIDNVREGRGLRK
jgi:S1-C subfamily serine protease